MDVFIFSCALGNIMLCVCLGMIWSSVMEQINNKHKKVFKCCIWLMGSIISGFIIVISINLSRENYKAEIGLINAECELLTIGINSEKLSEHEKYYLIVKAIEINYQINRLQFLAEQWDGFLIPDEVNDLELIDFK